LGVVVLSATVVGVVAGPSDMAIPLTIPAPRTLDIFEIFISGLALTKDAPFE
jgi:hypothetical protein